MATRASQPQRKASVRTRAGATQGTATPPHIREMRPAECLALVKSQRVGRIAFSFHDRVDILPVHYAYSGGWLFARTSHGAKMTTLQHSPWVAVEADEIDDVFNWRSVVIHGTVYVVERDGSAIEARLWRRGVAALRRIIPETASGDDPVPFRTLVFGIHIDRMTGRMSTKVAATTRARRTSR